MLFAGALVFSVLLYFGEEVPWFISVLGGAMSSLCLVSLGFYWIGTGTYPEMGWIFLLWSAVNLILSFVVIFGAFGVAPQRGRYEKDKDDPFE
jgi:hypothetical protein